MSVDDVWGVQTWHMNQSEADTEPDSATKDRKSKMTQTQEKSQLTASHYTFILSVPLLKYIIAT